MMRVALWSALLFLGTAVGFDQPGFLAWATWIVPCAGWHLGCESTRHRRDFAGVVGALLCLCLLGLTGTLAAAGAAFSLVALIGIFSVPFGLARRFSGPGSGSQGTAVIAILGLLLALAPTGAGLFESGWAQRSPALAGLAMDISPHVFVLECAGLDVFRMPLFYDSNTTDFVMGIRRPWNSPLAPMVLLVVGCVLALVPLKLTSTST